MTHTMDRLFILLETLGGILLFAAACASDGGLSLHATVVRAALAILLLGAGVLGRSLCTVWRRTGCSHTVHSGRVCPTESNGRTGKSESCA